MEDKPRLGLEYDIDSTKLETVSGKTVEEATERLNFVLYMARNIQVDLLDIEYKKNEESKEIHSFELVFYRYPRPTRERYFKSLKELEDLEKSVQQKSGPLH